MKEHSRRRGVVTSQKCTDHFDEKRILVQAKLIFDIGYGRTQEMDPIGFAMMVSIGLESLHDTVVLWQAAESTV